MKRVLSPYFSQNLSAPLHAADLSSVASSQILKSEADALVKLSPYFLGGSIEPTNMEHNEDSGHGQTNKEENGKKTKAALALQGQRRKAPIKVDNASLFGRALYDQRNVWSSKRQQPSK